MLFRSTALAVATSFAVLAQAQYEINPDDININIRNVWCKNQEETCPKICEQSKPGTTIVNECDPETLQYGCLCGDNKKPNISEYSLTIPYFVCREWTNQCVSDCKSDNTCASSCRQDNPCGAQDPTRETGTDSSIAEPTASKTDDGTTIYSGSPGGEDDSDNAAATLLGVGRSYGAAIVFGSMFFGFVFI